MTVRVKICGISDPDSAKAAVAAQADFIGMVFVEGVRRQVEVEKARSIVASLRKTTTSAVALRVVGLFLNQSVQHIHKVHNAVGLDMVQLCGSENETFYAELNLPIMRQIRVGDDEDVVTIRFKTEAHVNAGHMVVLDGKHGLLPGGTGLPWKWSKIKDIAAMPQVLLGGGLNPENVGGVISDLRAWGVDVSSGVESNNKKDSRKIRRFIRNTRLA